MGAGLAFQEARKYTVERSNLVQFRGFTVLMEHFVQFEVGNELKGKVFDVLYLLLNRFCQLKVDFVLVRIIFSVGKIEKTPESCK